MPTGAVLVRAARPRAGFCHPASRQDVAWVLDHLGAEHTYGVRSVELRQAPPEGRGGQLFGRLVVPGRILLYEQPISPWILRGVMSDRERGRLAKAGAVIERTPGGSTTIVSWPDGALRDFMRFDVLLHEVAHHVLQQYAGKRTTRIARTRDHERFADEFVRRYRAAATAEAGSA